MMRRTIKQVKEDEGEMKEEGWRMMPMRRRRMKREAEGGMKDADGEEEDGEEEAQARTVWSRSSRCRRPKDGRSAASRDQQRSITPCSAAGQPGGHGRYSWGVTGELRALGATGSTGSNWEYWV